MLEFRDVTVLKKANIYFDGGVTSRTVIFKDGSKKTLGIMQPGEYEFSTGEREIIEILDGDLNVLLPDSNSWLSVKSGESFEVPANSKFIVRVKRLTDYCCTFVK